MNNRVWASLVPVSFAIDRFRLVTTRMVTAGGTGVWGGYFADHWSGDSFVHQDCTSMMSLIDICDMFQTMQKD